MPSQSSLGSGALLEHNVSHASQAVSVRVSVRVLSKCKSRHQAQLLPCIVPVRGQSCKLIRAT